MGKSKRGFASMDPVRRRKIQSQGGKAAFASGKGHRWTSEEARLAGQKGGKRTQEERRRKENNE